MCANCATKVFSIQGLSFNGGKLLRGLRTQMTFDVDPPLRLREGEPEERAEVVGSGVASWVTLALLTKLVDVAGGPVLVLLLLPMGISLMADGAWTMEKNGVAG
jgi:hypothetical protein